MKIGASGFYGDEVGILTYLLYPYDIDLVGETDGSDLVISRGSSFASSKPLIRIPANREWDGTYLEPRSYGNGIVDLPFDFIGTCLRIFQKAMNPNVAFIYKFSTHLPFRYNIVPSSLRSHLLRIPRVDSNLSNHLTNEIARKILVEAFDVIGLRLRRKSPPSISITHDVDSRKGLQRALSLKAIEDNLNVQSIWFLPSDEYPIPREIARDLAQGSTIGSHDVKHDGRLIHIRKHGQLVQRLRESKLKLESVFEREVACFRSPMLQFSHKILVALGGAGYHFDFSAPCWEPVHPVTMTGFGVELAQAFEMDGVTERPLTLFQDHQVLNVLRMTTHEATKFWVDQAKLVHSLDGDVVLLVHPDYSFSRDLREYRRLLELLLELQVSFNARAP